MSTITAVPTPTVDELLDLVNGEDDESHYHCCLLDLTVCGQSTEKFDALEKADDTFKASCQTCQDIEAERIPWICPNCGCHIGQNCQLCL